MKLEKITNFLDNHPKLKKNLDIVFNGTVLPFSKLIGRLGLESSLIGSLLYLHPDTHNTFGNGNLPLYFFMPIVYYCASLGRMAIESFEATIYELKKGIPVNSRDLFNPGHLYNVVKKGREVKEKYKEDK